MPTIRYELTDGSLLCLILWSTPITGCLENADSSIDEEFGSSNEPGVEPVTGCMDETANSFDPNATESDLSVCTNDGEDVESTMKGPEQLSITTVEGSQEESHGHFILACTDGGFLKLSPV